jgi:hypothetical protein
LNNLKVLKEHQKRQLGDNLSGLSLPLKGKRIVQTEGYVPLNKRIENMMTAGVRLASARAEAYDADEKTPGSEVQGNMIRNLEKLEGLYKTTTIRQYLENKKAQMLERQERLKNAERNQEAQKQPNGSGSNSIQGSPSDATGVVGTPTKAE